MHDPDLILLDEPTSGLDPDGRAAMLALLKSLAQRPGNRCFSQLICLETLNMFAIMQL